MIITIYIIIWNPFSFLYKSIYLLTWLSLSTFCSIVSVFRVIPDYRAPFKRKAKVRVDGFSILSSFCFVCCCSCCCFLTSSRYYFFLLLFSMHDFFFIGNLSFMYSILKLPFSSLQINSSLIFFFSFSFRGCVRAF